jgi:uncharacterized protein (DUF488 family)
MDIAYRKNIYSIGTSNRTLLEFLHVLVEHGIKTVVDVRRFPTSKFEHFKGENLESSLKEEKIIYRYLGDELGGFRKEGFEAYLLTEKCMDGLEKLEGIALKNPCVILCAERLPWRCHRRFIGNYFREKGWEVVHIIDRERVWQPE